MTKTTIFLALFVGARARARVRAYKRTFRHALKAIKGIHQARTSKVIIITLWVSL